MGRKGDKKIKAPIGDPNILDSMYCFMLRFLESQRIANQSETTIEQREYNLRMFIQWCDDRGLIRPQEVTKPVIDRFQRHLFYYRKSNGAPLGAQAQSAYLMSVKAYFRWLTRQNYILYNPASEIVLPKVEKRLPRNILSASEAERIMNQPDLTTWQGVRDRAMLETLYSTGVRRKELLDIQYHDLDIERCTLFVRQGKGAKDRMVPIGARAVAWVEKYRNEVRPELAILHDNMTLFLSSLGQPITSNRLTKLVGDYVKAADIGKSGSCHMFRHTMATLMLDNGADVRFIQAMLGHADLSTTEVYTQVSVKKLQEIHTATHPAKLKT